MKSPLGRVSRRAVLVGAAQAAVAGTVISRPGAHVAADERKTGTPSWSQPKYVVWDVHGHLNWPDGTAQEKMAHLLRLADRMGIERVILFMGYPFSENPSPDELRRQNDQVLQALEHSGGRALGFVYLNPHHTQASLQELDRCVRDGPMVGVKLWVALRCHDERLDPLVQRAVELKAPILQHTWCKVMGNLPGESTAGDLAALAGRHPQASFIAAHTGGDWEQGIRAIRATVNVTAEVCGGDPTTGFVDMAVRELGARRVVFGTDYTGRSFASQLAKVYGADIPEESKCLILAGNIKRMLTPICAAKGIKL